MVGKGIKMNILHLTSANYDEVISKGLVLVDFWASWCTPCKMVAPIIDELANEHQGLLVVAKVDVDSEPTLAVRNDISSIPTVLLFQNGIEIKRIVGAQPKAAYQMALNARN